MRVTMLSKAVVLGSYQRKLEELARLPDIDLTVLAPPSWRDSRGEARLERIYTEGYQLIEIPIALNGHFHSHFYPGLGKALAAASPDLIHADEEPYNAACWQALRWAASHQCPSIFFTWQNLSRRYPPPFSWIEQYNYRHAAHAIAGNREAKQVLRAKGYAGTISVVPQFGVDAELFDSQSVQPLIARPPQAQLVVGYAGGLVPEKGIDTLLRAIAIGSQPEKTAANWHVVLAGAGPQQQALQTLSQRLGIAEALSFVGRIASIQMPAFYNSIDVLVLPSRTTQHWKEQFGRVLIEAMACRRPVVGSNSGEIPNVIGDAGYVFPEGNQEALAVLLQRLAQTPALRADLGQRGRRRVLEHYTQEKVALATYRVYRSVVGESSSAD